MTSTSSELFNTSSALPRRRAHYSDLIHSPHIFRVADSEDTRMEKITEFVLNGQEEASDDDANGQLDWILAGIICIVCIAFLVIAVKICYNYSKKFPESSEKEHESIENFNRRAISTKGTRGHVRYSVA
ncbi:uncharacterized protein CELE_W05E10.2 [Caenorhabditis elegans]|uniref:Uncharacterized protein n=1 Tax=Caenorhabditis elegans TaxID=6239 RepID=Q23174_CAEEL|nr:Uncharacterized protein CELE_W05E10.2 [Caenorhabditis elegans]CAB01248.3 Uncharacterized protein CELE_W05E10.2 [Caenorhabditis elegans]|eukprot:NP_505956.3 Uncharacterized protein CELE_W05E10.2 [Caenorhabditis elegans]